MNATPAIDEDRLIPLPDGRFQVRFTDPSTQKRGDGVMSIQKDGSIEWRPNGTNGQWEIAERAGKLLVWTDSAYPTGHYVALLFKRGE